MDIKKKIIEEIVKRKIIKDTQEKYPISTIKKELNVFFKNTIEECTSKIQNFEIDDNEWTLSSEPETIEKNTKVIFKIKMYATEISITVDYTPSFNEYLPSTTPKYFELTRLKIKINHSQTLHIKDETLYKENDTYFCETMDAIHIPKFQTHNLDNESSRVDHLTFQDILKKFFEQGFLNQEKNRPTSYSNPV